MEDAVKETMEDFPVSQMEYSFSPNVTQHLQCMVICISVWVGLMLDPLASLRSPTASSTLPRRSVELYHSKAGLINPN